ncbi:MAG: helix-turn-helix domain-containing protein [Spartobacteria bacterium]|nr:helix-turn-helix domain-containing protein [Spartobacteria bacterium]
MPFRFFNLAEAAEFLHMPAERVEELARRGELPCEHTGGRLSFRHHALDEWASRHLLESSAEILADFHRRTTAKYHDLAADAAIVPTLVKPEWIRPGLTCRSKSSILREMVELADATGLLCYRDELLESLVEREKLCSTALSGGLALLHPRNHEPYMFEDSFVVVGKTVGQVPFGSPDRSTTDVFFLICSQDDRIHLHVLARLCMMCHQTSLLLAMRGTDDPQELHRLLVDSERQIIGQTPKA